MRAHFTRTCGLIGCCWFVLGCDGSQVPRSVEVAPHVDRGVRLASMNVTPSEPPQTLSQLSQNFQPLIADAPGSEFTAYSPHSEMLSMALLAAQTRVNVAIHNIANASTIGFKRSRVLLTDQGYQSEASPGAEDGIGNVASSGIAIGNGVKVHAIQLDMSPGQHRATGRALDIAIEREGFLQIHDPTGQTFYTRCGSLALNKNQQVCLCSAGVSRLVVPSISIPLDTLDINISEEGLVSVQLAGQPSRSCVGQIQLARFVNPEGLQPLGDGLFGETEACGPPMIHNPGQNANGKIRQRALETSNVDIKAERAEWAAARETLSLLQWMQSQNTQSAAIR